MRPMLVADLLCGAGGSSTGCARALAGLGLKMELVCVNHWGVAIETHRRNHPEARHYVQDIATVRPHLIVPEGYLNLLMASPTCTHHSVARGGKPTSDQQRSDPWHIITWLTELRVKRIIIENVREFTNWGPVDPRTGKPIKSRKGEYFRQWIATLRGLGFEVEWRNLNAADFGDATTRQRFILMGRSDGKPIQWPVPTHRRREDGALELFPSMKPWRSAREIIDWSIKGKSIFDRKKPLAPKTLARIYAGAVKFHWPEPYLVILRNHMAGQSVDGPLPTIAAGGQHIGLVEPFILGRNGAEGGSAERRARSVDDPMPTSTNRGAGYIVEPFVVSAAHGVDKDDPDPHTRRVKSVNEPIGTVHAGGGNFGVVEPFVLSQVSGCAPRDVNQPIPTQTTGGNGAAHALISPYYGSGSGETCQSSEAPLPTITAKARFGMVVPITHTDGSQRARDVDSDPLPTLTTANRGELAFITAQHGERNGQAPRTHDVDQPAPTIAATGHVDLVEGTNEYDILFRMLEPHELAAAMGLNTDEQEYEFAGTKTEKIKQIGNAVAVSMMTACVSALMADAVSAAAVRRKARRAA